MWLIRAMQGKSSETLDQVVFKDTDDDDAWLEDGTCLVCACCDGDKPCWELIQFVHQASVIHETLVGWTEKNS